MQNFKPVFDRKHGSVTAANATPLTDGAAAVLMMSESKAKALGYEILGYVRSAMRFLRLAYMKTCSWVQLIQRQLALDRAGIELKRP